MDEKNIDEIAQQIFKAVHRHNLKPNNRKVIIQPKYRIKNGKTYFFQATWDDDRKSTHLIGAQIKTNNLEAAEFLSMNKRKIVNTRELPKKFEQTLAEIPKKTI